MIVGIVGSEEIKFTAKGKAAAQQLIFELLYRDQVTEVVSGKCHLGGIDIWAAEIGNALSLRVTEYPPEVLTWWAYKRRNLQIVDRSDEVHCITIDRLPDDYVGMRFDLCYHCKTKDHVKSGGCWTMKNAIAQGKAGILHVIEN